MRVKVWGWVGVRVRIRVRVRVKLGVRVRSEQLVLRRTERGEDGGEAQRHPLDAAVDAIRGRDHQGGDAGRDAQPRCVDAAASADTDHHRVTRRRFGWRPM